MNKIISVILIISISSKAVAVNMLTAQFSTETAEQQNGLSYKRVGSSFFGRSGRVSQLQCAKVCVNEDNCKTVYVDGEACVFGVDDVTAFEEGEVVTPDPSQVLRVKGKSLLWY